VPDRSKCHGPVGCAAENTLYAPVIDVVSIKRSPLG
jgi:hypothetical protein